MTVTLERWWTPEGKIRAEDMLKPGSDPQKDLGLALFALHRGGAEACELVAKTAVADEFVLAAALAETRALLAPLAVETVAKGVGSPQYAGLLLKDVLDDAEIAAVALYRTCLAKSVAPPIAAQRVGMVFGVPSRELSRYASLASDPKANPTAVADLADRTLFGYVSKVVNEEYVPAKETFAKAPVRANFPGEGEGEDYLDQHNVQNGPGGRFVREGQRSEVLPGVSLQDLFDRSEQRLQEERVEAPEVGTTPAPAKTTSGPRTGPRTAQRAKRVLRPRAARAQQQLQQQQLQQQQLRVRQLNTQQLSQQALAMQRLMPDVPAPMPMSGMPRSVPDLSKATGGSRSSTLIDKPISFILSEAEFMAVARAAGDSTRGNHVLRIGPLQEYAGKARLYEGEPGKAHKDHAAGVEHVLTIMESRISELNPNNLISEPIGDDVDLVSGTPEEIEARLYQAKLHWLRTVKARESLNFNESAEVGSVQHAPSMDDPTKMILIWRPPYKEQGSERWSPYVPAPTVMEMVVKPNAAHGKVVGTDVQVDPGSPLRMSNMSTRHPNSGSMRRTFWDPTLQAIRSTIVLEAASEQELDEARWKHSKADERYLEEHNVAHGADGRFVRDRAEVLPGVSLQELFDRSRAAQPTEEETPTPTPSRPRPPMARRARRAQRAKVQRRGKPGAPQELARQQLRPQRLGQQQLAQQAVSRQRLREKTDPFQHLVWFDDDQTYSAVDPVSIQRFVERGFPENASQPVHLDFHQRAALMDGGAAVGQGAELLVQKNAEQSWAQQVRRDAAGNIITKNERRVVSQALIDADYFTALGRYLGDLIEGNPKLSMYRVTMNSLAGGGIHVEVFTNIEALPVQHLVRYSDKAAQDDPRVMIPEPGTKRTQNPYTYEIWLRETYAAMQALDGKPVETTIANPHVKQWLVE